MTAMRGCVGDETSAREGLRRDSGKKYSATDKSNCASTPGMQFSYVELLTCLQMQHGGNLRPRRRQAPRPPQNPECAASPALGKSRTNWIEKLARSSAATDGCGAGSHGAGSRE